MSTLESNIEIKLSRLPLDLLKEIATIFYEEGATRIALIGGAVRDTLLEQIDPSNSHFILDIDLIVEGSASDLAKILQVKLGTGRVSNLRVYKTYNTAEVEIDGSKFDLATARVENYKAPGENPLIRACRLENDLLRRDFSVNAIAIDLREFKIIDPFNGVSALIKKHLEFLHSKSVSEDPTRIIRGARYAARLNFQISENSLKQIESSINDWPWEWHPEDPPELAPPALSTRLREEFYLLLNNEPWEKAILLLQNWGAMSLLDEQIQFERHLIQRLKWAIKLRIEPLTVLISSGKDPINLAKRLQLAKHQQELIINSIDINRFFNLNNPNENYLSWQPSHWAEELENKKWHPDAVGICICMRHPNWRFFLRWYKKWRKVTPPLSAKDLLNQGWVEGPEIGKELKRLRRELLDKRCK